MKQGAGRRSGPVQLLSITLAAEDAKVLNPSLTSRRSPEGLRTSEETHRLLDIVCLHRECTTEAPLFTACAFTEHWVTTVSNPVQV